MYVAIIFDKHDLYLHNKKIFLSDLLSCVYREVLEDNNATLQIAKDLSNIIRIIDI